jgi:hypothetical protein
MPPWKQVLGWIGMSTLSRARSASAWSFWMISAVVASPNSPYFQEDAHIPIAIVERLWRGHLDELATEDLLTELYGLSLLLGLDLNRHTLQIHDTIRRFLRDQAGERRLVGQHERLLEVLDEINGSDQADMMTWRYFYLQLQGNRVKKSTPNETCQVVVVPRSDKSSGLHGILFAGRF